MSKTETQERQRLRKEKAQQEENKKKQAAAREAAKVEHLDAFKADITDNDRSMRSAGEHLIKALDFGASQREAAETVGKAVSWVNRVAKWARSGFTPAAGPFSADGKAQRKRDKAKRVSPAKHPVEDQRHGLGGNYPPAERKTIDFPENGGGSQPVLMASAERPIEQVREEFAALAGETPPIDEARKTYVKAKLVEATEAANDASAAIRGEPLPADGEPSERPLSGKPDTGRTNGRPDDDDRPLAEKFRNALDAVLSLCLENSSALTAANAREFKAAMGSLGKLSEVLPRLAAPPKAKLH
jgi:hypothetical protein